MPAWGLQKFHAEAFHCLGHQREHAQGTCFPAWPSKLRSCGLRRRQAGFGSFEQILPLVLLRVPGGGQSSSAVVANRDSKEKYSLGNPKATRPSQPSCLAFPETYRLRKTPLCCLSPATRA